jgi:hypothetical protein
MAKAKEISGLVCAFGVITGDEMRQRIGDHFVHINRNYFVLSNFHNFELLNYEDLFLIINTS